MNSEAIEFRKQTLYRDEVVSQVCLGSISLKKTYNYLQSEYMNDPNNKNIRENILSFVQDVMKVKI